MIANAEKSLSALWTGALMFSVVAILGACVLAVSYNGSHKPVHSESWDGPSETMGSACSGPVSNWMRGIQEHRSRETDPFTETQETGFLARFATVVVPWHLENRPVLLYLFGFLELAVVFGANRLWMLEQAETQRRTGGRPIANRCT